MNVDAPSFTGRRDQDKAILEDTGERVVRVLREAREEEGSRRCVAGDAHAVHRAPRRDGVRLRLPYA